MNDLNGRLTDRLTSRLADSMTMCLLFQDVDEDGIGLTAILPREKRKDKRIDSCGVRERGRGGGGAGGGREGGLDKQEKMNSGLQEYAMQR